MQIKSFKRISFFLSLGLISMSLTGCGGGGGGGGVALNSGNINPALFSGWEMTNGPFSGTVYSLAVDPNNGQKVYAAVEIGGLVTSSDGGRSWTHIEGDLTNASISSVDVHVDGLTIYVGTGSDGVYKSSDGGKTWAQVSNGLPVDSNTNKYYEIFAITIDPTDADTVYTLSGDRWYICVTTDGGASWTRIDGGARPQGGLPWDRIEAFVIHPDNTQLLYVGTDKNGVYKSEDMGDSWVSINGDPAIGGLPAYVMNIPCLGIGGANNILYAGSRDYGLWKTLDDGVKWEVIEIGPNTGLEYWDVYALTVDPIDKATIYAYVETVPPTVQPMDDGMYRTFDGGENWERVPFHEYPGTYRPVREIVIAPSNGDIVYVTTQGEGLFMTSDVMSLDDVRDWLSIDNGLVDLPVHAMIVHPWDNKTVYVGTPRGLFKTTNGGVGWERKGLQGETVYALIIDPTNPSSIYAATYTGVYKTANDGDTWSNKAGGSWFCSLAIGRDPLNPGANILYGGSAAGKGIYKAMDDGSTSWDAVAWEEKNNGLNADEKYVQCLAIDPSDPSVLYAGTGYRRDQVTAGDVIKTQNGGDNWVPKTTGLPPNEPVCSLSIDPNNPQVLFAGTFVGFYASSNGGDSWAFRDGGMGQRYIRSISIDSTDSSRVCAGTYYDGVFASIDGGENWAQLNKGLVGDLNKRVISLAMDVSNIDDPVIYAGTGCGVFKAYK